MDKSMTIENVARNNADKIVSALKKNTANTGMNVYAANECELIGSPEGDMINLTLENGTASDKIFFFGTPLGISAEAPTVKKIWDAVAQTNRWDDDLANITDNNGTGAELFQEYNKRATRRPALLSSVTVVTDNQVQRSISIEKVIVPVNILNARTESVATKGVYTEFSETNLVSDVIVWGEFSGFSYLVKAGVTVQLNIKVHAVDKSVFKS